MSDKTFYTIGVAFASGIFTRSFFDLPITFTLLGILIALASIVSWRLVYSDRRNHSPLVLLACAVLSFSVGMFRVDVVENSASPFAEFEGREVALIGTIVREPDVRARMVQLVVTPTGDTRFHGERVLVSLDAFRFMHLGVGYGDTLSVSGTLTPPEPFATDTGRVFDYPEYQRARGIEYTIPFAEVTLLSHDTSTFRGTLIRAKESLIHTIETYIPEPQAGLGEGILLGVKRALGENLEQTFRETGIIHIVVLSGYNIMIVVTALMYVLKQFFFPGTRMMIGILGIATFALLVGPSATVVRASLMAALLLIAQTTGKTYRALRALFCVGLGMLLHNPLLLMHDPGFQLSFLATFGLIVLMPHIESRFVWVPERFGMRSIVSATLATQLFVLPLLLYQTGLLSYVALIVNALVLPAIPFAMILVFLTGTLGMFVGVGGTIFGYLAYGVLSYVIHLAEFFGALPVASHTFPPFPFWVALLMYGALGYTVIRLEHTQKSKEVTVSEYDEWIIEEEKSEETLIPHAHMIGEQRLSTNDYRGWIVGVGHEDSSRIKDRDSA